MIDIDQFIFLNIIDHTNELEEFKEFVKSKYPHKKMIKDNWEIIYLKWAMEKVDKEDKSLKRVISAI